MSSMIRRQLVQQRPMVMTATQFVTRGAQSAGKTFAEKQRARLDGKTKETVNAEKMPYIDILERQMQSKPELTGIIYIYI